MAVLHKILFLCYYVNIDMFFLLLETTSNIVRTQEEKCQYADAALHAIFAIPWLSFIQKFSLRSMGG